MDLNTFIVIITYNSADYIENCFDSINISCNRNCFLAVIDNNSRDGTEVKIQNFISSSGEFNENNFKFIKLNINIGFAAAVNFAVFNFLLKERAEPLQNIEYLVLLNPDIVLESGSISNLIKTFKLAKSGNSFETDKAIGVAGGLIYNYDKNKIQHTGGAFRDNFITYHLINPSSSKYLPGYVTGALFATKISYFVSLGGFDSGYRPVYFEELDYCLKIKKMGLSIIVNPEVKAKHYGAASIKKFSPNFYRYYHKNRIRCAILNLSLVLFFKKFFPAEIKWLKNEATQDQCKPLLYSYFLNFLFLPYNLIIRLKNYLRFNNLKFK